MTSIPSPPAHCVSERQKTREKGRLSGLTVVRPVVVKPETLSKRLSKGLTFHRNGMTPIKETATMLTLASTMAELMFSSFFLKRLSSTIPRTKDMMAVMKKSVCGLSPYIHAMKTGSTERIPIASSTVPRYERMERNSMLSYYLMDIKTLLMCNKRAASYQYIFIPVCNILILSERRLKASRDAFYP